MTKQLWERIKIFWQFYRKAKTRYQIHSPLLSGIVQAVQFGRLETDDLKLINRYRRNVLQQQRTIPVSEFGMAHGQSGLVVSEYSKKSAAGIAQAAFLYKLTKHTAPQSILELGSCTGVSALSMHLANPNASLTSIEGNEMLSNFCKEGFLKIGIRQVHFFHRKFNDYLNAAEHHHFDLIFIDGDHTKVALLTHFESCLNHCSENAIIILDDIHWSADMYEAWDQIKQHVLVRGSLEFSRNGILFLTPRMDGVHVVVVPWIYKPWNLGIFT